MIIRNIVLVLRMSRFKSEPLARSDSLICRTQVVKRNSKNIVKGPTFALFWNHVVFVVKLQLCEIAEGCIGMPNDTLRPRTGFKHFVSRGRKIVLRIRLMEFGCAKCWFVYNLVFPIGE